MIKLEKDTLFKLQMNELEMLLEVDRICRKHKINYSLEGGTLLGAVRHGGFIPWDDDADVNMLRSEYDRFYEACKTELDTSRFFLQEYRTDKNYRWGYSKLRRKDTIFLREHQEHVQCNQGVFIDIFILDNVPNQWFLRKVHLFCCYCFRKILYSEVGKRRTKNKLLKRWYQLLALIPRDVVFAGINIVSKSCNKRDTELIRHMTYPYVGCRYGHTKSLFYEYEELVFEGYKFLGIKDTDKYLMEHYGDYKRIPSKEERKTHPVSQINLVENELYKQRMDGNRIQTL